MVRIAVDVDEVLFPAKEPFYNYLNKKLGLSLDWTSPHYEFAKEMGLPKEDVRKYYWEFANSDEFRLLSPLDGAIEGVNAFHKLSELYVVTSRQNYLEEATICALDYHFRGMFSGLEMGNHHNHLDPNNEKTKSEMCRKIGADLLIDDQIRYAQELWREIPVILFDQPWNQNFGVWNVFRAGNWREGYGRGWIEAQKIAQRILK